MISLNSIVLFGSWVGVSKWKRFDMKEGLSGKMDDDCFLTLARWGVSAASRRRLSSTKSQKSLSITFGNTGSGGARSDGGFVERAFFVNLRLASSH